MTVYQYAKRLCPQCGGSTWLDADEEIDCPMCHGLGYVVENAPSVDDNRWLAGGGAGPQTGREAARKGPEVPPPSLPVVRQALRADHGAREPRQDRSHGSDRAARAGGGGGR